MKGFQARVLQLHSQADAEQELRRIGVDPGGICRMAPKMLARSIHLAGLQCRQANIIKQEMLSLGGDAAVARGTVACSIEKTDLILIGTDRQLQQLCQKLTAQPFRLPLLAEELAGLLSAIKAPPAIWKTSRRDIPLERPIIMGILNITPDSFSDGSLYIDPQQALEHALQMIAEGADIIDIGGESTRPGAADISHEEEIRRIMPVISLLADKVSCPVSVDTRKLKVAEAALSAGAEIINDISGLTFEPKLASLVAESGAGVVLMHTRGTPGNMQQDTSYGDLIGEIHSHLGQLLENALAHGIEKNRIVLDPGIGFGKSAAGNLEILRRLREFSSLGQPLLIGTSRKSFIGSTLKREAGERVYGTAATVALAAAGGASILRVHDVAAMRDVADMAHAIATVPNS
jgi:dihydropteroate synthase